MDMKDEKVRKTGFTLIELLVTIAIVAIVIVSVSFGVLKLIDNSKEKTKKATYNSIVKSSGLYVEEFKEQIEWFDNYDENEFTCTTVQMLKNKGYLKEDIDLEYDGKIINNQSQIKVLRNKNTYVINDEVFMPSEECGEFDNINNVSVSILVDGDEGNNGWIKDNAKADINVSTIGKSGVKNVSYSVKKSDSTIATVDSGVKDSGFDNFVVPLTLNGENLSVCVNVTNGLDQTKEFCSSNYKYDNYQPVNKIDAGDGVLSGEWHNGIKNPSSLTLKVKDNTSASGINYYLDTNSNPVSLRQSINITTETSGTTYYSKVCTKAGKCSGIESYFVKYDKTKPVIDFFVISNDCDGTACTLGYHAYDKLSGIVWDRITMSSNYCDMVSISGGDGTSFGSITVSESKSKTGMYYLCIVDMAGNYSVKERNLYSLYASESPDSEWGSLADSKPF